MVGAAGGIGYGVGGLLEKKLIRGSRVEDWIQSGYEGALGKHMTDEEAMAQGEALVRKRITSMRTPGDRLPMAAGAENIPVPTAPAAVVAPAMTENTRTIGENTEAVKALTRALTVMGPKSTSRYPSTASFAGYGTTTGKGN
jgi:hypothetical protein